MDYIVHFLLPLSSLKQPINDHISAYHKDFTSFIFVAPMCKLSVIRFAQTANSVPKFKNIF